MIKDKERTRADLYPPRATATQYSLNGSCKNLFIFSHFEEAAKPAAVWERNAYRRQGQGSLPTPSQRSVSGSSSTSLLSPIEALYVTIDIIIVIIVLDIVIVSITKCCHYYRQDNILISPCWAAGKAWGTDLKEHGFPPFSQSLEFMRVFESQAVIIVRE